MGEKGITQLGKKMSRNQQKVTKKRENYKKITKKLGKDVQKIIFIIDFSFTFKIMFQGLGLFEVTVSFIEAIFSFIVHKLNV